MKKRYFIILALLLLFPLNTKAYTRKDLQDIVVSTAVSYYYNNKYTDYEGYIHDNASSMYTHNYLLTPELLSRSNYMTTQCEAFTIATYMNSIGFDFSYYRDFLKTCYSKGYCSKSQSSYYKYSSSNSSNYVFGYNSESDFKILYKYFDRGFSVKLLLTLAYDTSRAVSVYYKYCKNSDATCLSEAANYVSKNIEPGDILLNEGHAMLWVGDVFENGGGAIHSSGGSYDPSKGYTGYDDYSVRYSSKDYIINKQVKAHGSSNNTVVAILRPINYYCGKGTNDNETCDTPNYINGSSSTSTTTNNAIARTKLKRLRVEQYIYDPAENKILNYNTSSIGKGDKISYRLSLTNKSSFNICSTDTTTNEESCKEVTNEKTYKNVEVKAVIPDGTTLTGYYPDTKCSKRVTTDCIVIDGKNITWNISSIGESDSKTYYYTVRVNNDYTGSSITNKGMKVVYDSSTLSLTSITTKVNSTITGKYSTILKKIASSKKGTKCTNGVEFVSSVYNEFLTNSNVNNTSGDKTNLSYWLTSKNIKDYTTSVFTKYGSYYRRNSSSTSVLNTMLVPKLYGGRKYINVYTGSDMEDKITPIWSTLGALNVGDVIVTVKGTTVDAILYTGVDNNTQSIYYCNNGTITYLTLKNAKYTNSYISSTGSAGTFKSEGEIPIYSNRIFLDKIHSSDLYIVIRPSAYYKPKLKYTLTYNLNYSNSKWDSTSCGSGFKYNKSTGECTKIVDYNAAYGSTPKPTRSGYTFSGWVVYLYNSKTKKYDIKTPISESKIFEVGYNQNVYAQWTPNIYSVSLDDTATIYEKYNNGWCSDKACKTSITKIKPISKTGY